MAADGEQKDENRLVKIDLDDAGKPRRSMTFLKIIFSVLSHKQGRFT